MKRVLKRLGTLMIICVLCLSQSVQLPLQARQIVPAEAEAKMEVKISPTDLIRSGFKVRVETPKGLHTDYDNKWVIKMSEKSNTGYDSCVYSRIWINDQRVYCVDPLTNAVDGSQDYDDISFGAYVTDASVRQKLSYITALGYGFQGDTSHEMDFATQVCIWRTLHEWKPGQYPSISHIHADIQKKISQIESRLALMEKEVSFHGTQVKLHALGEEDAVTLRDEHGLFQWYVPSEISEGLHVEQDGNALRIWADQEMETGKVTFSCLYENASAIIPVVFDSPTSQDVMTLGRPSPKLAEVSVEVRVNGALRILKKDVQSKEMIEIAGVQFGVYRASDGQLVEVIETDESGTAQIDALPYGDYEIREHKAPYGYVLNTAPIKVSIGEDGEHETLPDGKTPLICVTVENEQTEVRFHKLDASTGAFLAGAELRIYPEDDPKTILKQWTSADAPEVVRGLPCGQRLILEETSAPYGFACSEKIVFELDEDGRVYVYDEEGVRHAVQDATVTMEDELVKGRLSWQKTGSLYQRNEKQESEFGTMLTPVWEEGTLSGAQIAIFAAEDITVGGVTYAKQDEQVAVLESGSAPVQSPDLLCGKYYYVETRTLPGHVIDRQRHPFEIKDDESTELQLVSDRLHNAHVRIRLQFHKQMEEPQYSELGDALANVRFGIFAVSDICFSDGSIGIPAGQLISVSGVDAQGMLEDCPDLPQGDYVLRELATDERYQLSETEYPFTVSFGQEDVSMITIALGDAVNVLKRGSIELIKADAEDGSLLEGARFALYADAALQDLVMEGESGPDGRIVFDDLEFGDYWIVEEQAPYGYARTDDIYHVQISDDHQQLQLRVENEAVLSDLKIQKVDSASGEPIKGRDFVFGLYADEACKTLIMKAHADQESATAVFSGLRYGTYYLKELQAPEGYQRSNEVSKIVLDEDTPGVSQTVSIRIENTRKPKTAANSTALPWVALSAGSILAAAWLRRKHRAH